MSKKKKGEVHQGLQVLSNDEETYHANNGGMLTGRFGRQRELGQRWGSRAGRRETTHGMLWNLVTCSSRKGYIAWPYHRI